MRHAQRRVCACRSTPVGSACRGRRRLRTRRSQADKAARPHGEIFFFLHRAGFIVHRAGFIFFGGSPRDEKLQKPLGRRACAGMGQHPAFGGDDSADGALIRRP